MRAREATATADEGGVRPAFSSCLSPDPAAPFNDGGGGVSFSRTRYSSRLRPKSFEPGGTELVSHTLPPITEPAPITVSPPRIVAPA